MKGLKLGVIIDGISRDAETAFRIMNEYGLKYAELQFIYDREIGDQTDEEIKKIKKLLHEYNIRVCCITRHNFAGLPWDTPLDSPLIQKHTEAIKRCFRLAEEFDSPLVRLMSCRKEMILFGSRGAEKWVTSSGAWEGQKKITEYAVGLAEKAGQSLVTETCNGGMITSNYLAKKIIDELGVGETLGILWDPCNSLYCTECPYPYGYDTGKEYIRHIHIKDASINIPRATVEFRSLGRGDMAPYLEDIANALKEDNYQGVVSLEANYCPEGKTFLDGFRSSVRTFREIFS